MVGEVKMYKYLTIIFLLCVAASFAEEDGLTVTLPYGKIRGHLLRSENDTEYYAFQEIPYATPPVGELRFKPPVAPESWEGILDTTNNTKICYQQNPPVPTPNVTETEDCLYINVYTPQKPGSSKTLLPVFVWIHGGAFLYGDATFRQIGPKFFIDSGIVIAAMNYRLGPLGFLTTDDGVIPGNLGLKDQNLGLKWVKENIELFGGDPEKITIAGESAGGFSVGYQFISKKSAGLFRGAILQSGTALSPDAYQAFSRYLAFELGKTLNPNFTSDDSLDLLALLQNASAADITYTPLTLPEGKNVGSLLWTPIIEDKTDEEAFITAPMDEDIKNGNVNRVPIIIGFNSEEEITFISFGIVDQSDLKETGAKFDEDPSLLVDLTFNITDENKKIAGSELRKIYTNGTFQDNFAGLVSYTSDNTFTTPSCRHADLQSWYTDVFLYQFSYKGDLGGSRWDIEGLDPNGVGHAEDLSYIWDTGHNSDASKYPEEDILTRNRILKMWSNFVKYLNPTPEEDSLLQNVVWPKVTSDNFRYLDINATLEVKVDPKQYKKWKKIIDTYAIPPYISY